MGCLLAFLALVAPRVAIVLIVFFSDYFLRAYDSGCWTCLGFLFMPTTTIAYAWAKNTTGGVEGLQLVVVVVAVLIDFGLIGGGARRARSEWDWDE